MTELKEMYYNNIEIKDKKMLKRGINTAKIVDILIEWGKKYNGKFEKDNDKSIRIFKNISILKSMEEMKNNGEKSGEKIKLNEDFTNAVMSNIPKNIDKISLARAIYIELNKRVKYDEKFSFYDQDLSLDFINKIYNMDINKVGKENNKITCKSWSEIYVDLLKMNDIKAYIVGGNHKYVKFFIKGEIFTADATEQKIRDNIMEFINKNKNKNKNEKQEERESMTDLARAKYGIKPEGFTCESDYMFDFDKIDSELNYGFKPTKINEEIKELLKEFKCDVDKDESDKANLVFEFIRTLEEKNKKYDAKGLEKYSYYANIIMKNLEIQIGIFSKIYIENKNGEYEMVTTIVTGDGTESKQCILINSVDGVLKIDPKELKKQIENGKYMMFKSKPKSKNNYGNNKRYSESNREK